MANFIVSPNMSLIIPSVLAELGPAYAQDINSSLSTLDQHNHSPGSGVQITPSGLNLSSDLTFLSNNATNVRSVRFSLFSAIGDFNPTASDINCALDVGGDLYFIDGSGNQIQITKNGFVNSGSGSISGLSGYPNASASYNGITGTFAWEQGIGQAANMDAATLIIRYPGSYPSPAGNFIALQAPAALSTGYALTFPLTLPAVNNSWMVSDTSGSESWINADNVTTEVASSVLRVKAAGITTAQISPSANILGSQLDPSANILGSQLDPSANILGSQLDPAANILRSQIEPSNIQISASCGVFSTISTIGVPVTNLSVTITTEGKPIYIGLQSDASASIDSTVFDSIAAPNAQAVSFLLIRRDTSAAIYKWPVLIRTPSGAYMIIDTPPAGVHTYDVTATAGGGGHDCSVSQTCLYAYEIA